jgi:DNA-binding MarR family transcriptional regulator
MLRYSVNRQRKLVGPKNKKDYGVAFSELGREMSVHTVMFHNAVAERLGLNVTDHKCLDCLLRYGPITAGQLAKLTGLTTGAITGVLDRLEKGGFAKRQPDPKDRRKVVIVPVPDKLQEMGKLFGFLGKNMAGIMSNYTTKEAEVVLDFMQRAVSVMREANIRVRALPRGKNSR